MEIYITYGTGEGLTSLAAFDAALFDAGISDYNLIKLSSIIPKNCRVIINKFKPKDIEYGHRLYVVLSSGVQTKSSKMIHAGLGWRNSGQDGGILVEHQAAKKKEVIKKINNSLKSVEKYRSVDGEIEYKVTGAKCKDKPVCALVVAVFKSEGWD